MTSCRRFPTLVVIDATVVDYPALVSDVRPDTNILVLDQHRDGIEQITQALATVESVESIHIVSHGSSGALKLGATDLNWQSLAQYKPQIKTWAKSLKQGAEILLYGCEVAAGAVGQWFVQQLKSLTGAEIAASTNRTGSAELGGDWILEFATGAIHTPLVFSPAATAAYPHVLAVLVSDTFRDSDVVNKNWVTGIGDPAPGGTPSFEPFLTARDTTAKPQGGIAGNPSIITDAPGEGALRLTTNIGDQAAFTLFNQALASNQGLTITFELFAYGGTTNPEKADGVSFFLLDGAVTDIRTAGAFGGSLGYAQKNGIANGIAGGYLGIGFDEFGNYSSETDSAGGDIVRTGGNPAGRVPDSIAIRGSAGSNYTFLGGTDSLPFGIDSPTATTREAAKRTVKVDLTPTGFLTVQIDGNNDGDFLDVGESDPDLTNIDVTTLTGTTIPSTLKFGFASGTGDFNNIHEIRNLVVSTLNNPPTAVDFSATVVVGSTSVLPGFAATDPDQGDSIKSYTISTLPDPSQGVLYVGDPSNGGVAVTVGTALTPEQIQNIYFQSTTSFSGATFTYTATDSRGTPDPSPAVVTLNPKSGGGGTGTNQPPDTASSSLSVPQNTAALVPGLSGTDSDGNVVSFTILTVPPAGQGKLFLGDPDKGGTAIKAGQVLTPDEIKQVYFQSSSGFTGSRFTYAATDDAGATDTTPAVVDLKLKSGVEDVNPDCKPGKNIKGTNSDNTLTGTPNIDQIRGLDGNDKILGRDCNDMLDGGRGDDKLAGGAARDVLMGRQNRDVARGNTGNDKLNLGLGNDKGFGGKGDDVGYGRRGNDKLYGKGGNDQLFGGRNKDELFGNSNIDYLDGQQGSDVLKGGGGDDGLNGGLGDDKLRGSRRLDTAFGRRGNDTIWGGGGEDTLLGQIGNDRISGNTQDDTISGGRGNDTITGGGGDDRIRTGAGADRIRYRSAQHGVDLIVDFNTAKDEIDLRDIFSKSAYTSADALKDYVRFGNSGQGAALRVDSDGGESGNFVRLAIFRGLEVANLRTEATFLV